MKVGVLDIGSNAAQLQVVQAHAEAPPLPMHSVKEATLLSESIAPDGCIAETGIRDVVRAVRQSLIAADRLGVEELYVLATAAIRDAGNRDVVLAEIENATGLRPQCLPGEAEAWLTYLAARRWYGWSAGRLLMLDIGGGSMEVVLGRDTEPELVVSLPLGAGRLTRSFLAGDPPAKSEIKEMRRHIKATLKEVADRIRWEGSPARTVLTSKTFKQLARLTGAAPQHRGPFVHRPLTLSGVREQIPILAELPAQRRARLRGISRSRARQILAGAHVAHLTMRALNVERAEICPWALREGVILHHMFLHRSDPISPLLTPVRRQPLGGSNVRHLPAETPKSG